jgi:transcriptional regulator with XRE-family HTH domain
MRQGSTLAPVVKLTRLRTWRERKALTQDELAELAGVSRQTVVKLEGGLEPRPPTIRKLAKALGVEPSELMDPADANS